jgi:MraZ protein
MPKKLLEQLDLSSNKSFAIRKKLDDQCLELFHYNGFQEEMEVITKQINRDSSEEEEALFYALTDVDVIDLDASERLPLPKRFDEEIGTGNDIVIRGVGNCFEIRIAAQYEKRNDERKKNEKALKQLRSKLSKAYKDNEQKVQ